MAEAEINGRFHIFWTGGAYSLRESARAGKIVAKDTDTHPGIVFNSFTRRLESLAHTYVGKIIKKRFVPWHEVLFAAQLDLQSLGA